MDSSGSNERKGSNGVRRHRKKVRSKKDVIDDFGHDDGNNKGICDVQYRQIVAV